MTAWARTDPLPDDVEPDYDRLPEMLNEAILYQRHDIRRHIIDNATPLDFTVTPFDDEGALHVLIAGVPIRRIHWSELADTPNDAA